MLGSMLDSRNSIRRLTSSSFSVAQKALIHLQPDSPPKITASGPNTPACGLRHTSAAFLPTGNVWHRIVHVSMRYARLVS